MKAIQGSHGNIIHTMPHPDPLHNFPSRYPHTSHRFTRLAVRCYMLEQQLHHKVKSFCSNVSFCSLESITHIGKSYASRATVPTLSQKMWGRGKSVKLDYSDIFQSFWNKPIRLVHKEQLLKPYFADNILLFLYLGYMYLFVWKVILPVMRQRSLALIT